MANNIKTLLRKVERQGFIVEHGSKHIKVYSADRREMVTIARSASDRRAIYNICNDLKRKLGVTL